MLEDEYEGRHSGLPHLPHFLATFWLSVFRSLNDGTESRPSQVFEAGQRGVDEESDDQKEYAAMDGDAQTLPSL